MGLFSSIGNFLSAPLKALNPNNWLNGNPLKNIFGDSGKFGLGKPDGSNIDFLEMIPFIGEGVTAQKNRQAQIDANNLNYQMFQEQNTFNEEQARLAFQRESEFNSEQAQVSRLKQAGLNPAAAFGQSSTASAPAASAGSPVPMQPATSDFSPTAAFDATMKGVVQGENLKVLDSLLEGNNLDNQTKQLLLNDLKETLGLDKEAKQLSNEELQERIQNYRDEREGRIFDRNLRQSQFDLEKEDAEFKKQVHQDNLRQFNEQNKQEWARIRNEAARIANESKSIEQAERFKKQEQLQSFNSNLREYCNNLRKYNLEKKKIKIAARSLIINLRRSYPNTYNASDINRLMKHFDKYVEDM